MKIKYLISLFLSMSLVAQSAAQTLQFVAKETLINNPEIQALRKNTKANRQYVDEEQGKYLPTLSLDTYFEEKKTLREGTTTRQDGVNTQLKLEQTLFDGGLTSARVSEADHNYQSNRIKNVEKIETILQETIDAYLNVVKNEELTLLSKNNLAIHEDYLITAQQSEDVSGDSLDRMQVESKLFSAKAKYVKLQDDSNKAKANLVKYYGKPLDGLICRPNVNNGAVGSDLDRLIADAVAVNYTILESLEGIKAQRSVLSQEQSRFFPTIKARLLREIDDGVDQKDVKKTEDTVRLSLSYNIFNGFQDRAIYERERLFLQESQKKLDNVVDTVKEEVKINFSKFKTSKERINFLKEYLAKNKNILQVYLEQFEGGTRSFIDILNHEAEIFRAKTELVEEEFTYYSSYYALLALQSRLSETVLSSKNQICKPIKVDIEKRELRLKDSGDDEQELQDLFNDDSATPSQEVIGSKQQQDAEVQSILSRILNEIYTPNAKNKNINVSSQGVVIEEEKVPVKIKEVKQTPQEKAIQKTIQERQFEEEEALRQENETLKEQIKKETQKILNNGETPSTKNETINNEKEVKKKPTLKLDNPKSSSKLDETPIAKKEKSAIDKLLEERMRLRKLAKAIENEVDGSDVVQPKSKSVKKSWDEMTLKEKQAESRRLGAKIRKEYREKLAKKKQAKEDALLKQQKAEQEKSALLEKKKKEEAAQKAKLLKEQEEAKRIKAEAVKKAQILKAEQEEKARLEQKKKEEAAQKEKRLKEQEEAKRIKAEAIKKAQKLKSEQEEKVRLEQKKKEEAEQKTKLLKNQETERLRVEKAKAQVLLEKQRREEEKLRLEKEKSEKAKAISLEKEKAQKQKTQKTKNETKLKAEKLAREQAESRRIAALIREKYRKKLEQEKEEKEEAKQLEIQKQEAKKQKEIEAKKQAQKIKAEALKKAEALAAKKLEEAKRKEQLLIKQRREEELKAQAQAKEERLKEEKAQALRKKQEAFKVAKELKDKEDEIERIKKEQEIAQQQLRQEAKLQAVKEKEERAKGDAARAKAKAIIEEIRTTNEISKDENTIEVQNREIKTVDDTVLKAQKIVDEIKANKQKEQSQEKAKELAIKLKDKEQINPTKEGNYFKTKELVSQDDARDKAKLIVDEIREENRKRVANNAQEDITQKAKLIVDDIKQNKVNRQETTNKKPDSSDEVVSKAKALVSEIKAQTPNRKEQSIEKAKSLISDIKAKQNKDEIQEYRLNETQTLQKGAPYLTLKKEFKDLQTKKYTISILTLDSKKNTDLIKNRYSLNEDVVTYKLMNDGKKYYKVLYGVYETRKDAQKAIEGLHPKLQNNQPFVDRISKHQKLYAKYNVNSGE